ncbi:FtsX-like permease family protein [Luteimicrobium subarcticum]|uniref:Putative ABC transport system permease protein n=1 Tax=Luteimicrobium subarcticum TaxID=620910 RepID=A0A2M8WTE9_9MICO|nr:FtsX-like permease family protein [Luteimicrobium subarcticum]PJI94225.1 putative ABC transport system permease protein [Luteimicrobium subarcticum]
MLAVTLAEMRRSAGRLAAAGVAILLGSAFVCVTLLTGNVIERAFTDAAAARYGQADMVAEWTSGTGVHPATLTRVRTLPQVRAADPVADTTIAYQAGDRTVSQATVGTATSPDLDPQTVASGRLPTAPGEVALPVHLAAQLGVDVGGTVTVTPPADTTSDGTSDGTGRRTPVDLTVTGTVDDPHGAFRDTGGAAVVDPALLDRWRALDGEGAVFTLAVATAPGTTPAELTRALASVLPDPEVRTRAEVAQSNASRLTGGTDAFTGVVLTFAAISLLVAALVIANTFQVLVAQRTRMLALLRCVGATRGQVAAAVVGEAALLGLVASGAGVAAGYLLGQLALVVAQAHTDLPLPAAVTPSVASVLVPVVVGTLVTVVASLVPARAATRVAPLVALRPADAPHVDRKAGASRLAGSLLLVLGGGGLMALGVVAGYAGAPQAGLAAAFLGGTLSFVGVLVGAVLWMPHVVHAAGHLLGRFGPASRLAAANTLRNPRRTTATATALLIGVTLVATMSVGAATASRSLATSLDGVYPYDIEVDAYGDGTAGTPSLPADVLRRIAAVDGVVAVAPVTTATMAVAAPDGRTSSDSEQTLVLGVDRATAERALRDTALLDGLDDRTVVVSRTPWVWSPPTDGEDAAGVGLRPVGTDGTATGPVVHLAARAADRAPAGGVYVTAATLRRIAPDAVTTTAWIRVGDDAGAAHVVSDVQQVLSDAGIDAGVSGLAAEREGTQDVIDTLLRIVLGLLAVAVVIAIIGVANTLSLSVIERRRESATLRALGLTRGRLRWMLAQEGMLIAVVGTVTGLVLGTAYGWAGAGAALASTGGVRVGIPWVTLGTVLVVAVAAGLAASVVPGRSAARTPPVAALAVE